MNGPTDAMDYFAIGEDEKRVGEKKREPGVQEMLDQLPLDEAGSPLAEENLPQVGGRRKRRATRRKSQRRRRSTRRHRRHRR
jgi:hypothetical protein